MAISTISHPLFNELGYEKIDFHENEKSAALWYYEEVVKKQEKPEAVK